MSVTSTTELEANQISTGLYYMQAMLPGWSERVSLLQIAKDGSGAHPASYSVGTEVTSRG